MTERAEFDDEAVIEVLERHRVRYIAVGGWAAQQYGAVRPTKDLDVCPALDHENLDRLAAALSELGAELYLDERESVPVPRIDGRLLAGMAVGNWRTRAGDLDILQGIPRASEEDRIGYADLLARAEPRPGPGHTILVASLEDIIRSKEVANRPKDREALVELRRLADEIEPVALAGDDIDPRAAPPPDLEL